MSIYYCRLMVEFTLWRAQKGNTALMVAAWEGRMDCVRLLLEAGAKKEAKNQVRSSDRCLLTTVMCAIG